MAERLVLHVGLMKSGTSFVQQVLQHNRQALRRRGVLFPTPWRRQVRAVRDLIEHGDGDQPPLADDGPWRSLRQSVRAWPGTAVVSMEFLGPRRLSKVRQVARELDGTDVEVVVSVRDLARTIPAMWQENVQNRGSRSWPAYLDDVRRGEGAADGPGSGFWRRQDAPRVVRTWQQGFGADHVTVLTVPPPGSPPGLLWERFAGVLGVDPGGLDLDVRGNASLGLASLEVLREVNARLADGVDGPPISAGAYERTLKQVLAKRGLARRTGEPRLGYDAPWVVHRADRDVVALRALAPRVVGDLEELRAVPVRGTDPADVPAEARLEAALDALALVSERLARRRGARADGRARGTGPGRP